jgi:hypothetical protein
MIETVFINISPEMHSSRILTWVSDNQLFILPYRNSSICPPFASTKASATHIIVTCRQTNILESHALSEYLTQVQFGEFPHHPLAKKLINPTSSNPLDYVR